MHELTERQRQALVFIADSIKDRGYPPTLREIGRHLGIRSTNGVNDHLRALERKGHLSRDMMTARGLQLTEYGLTALGRGPLVPPPPETPIEAKPNGWSVAEILAAMTHVHANAILMRDAGIVMRGAA